MMLHSIRLLVQFLPKHCSTLSKMKLTFLPPLPALPQEQHFLLDMLQMLIAPLHGPQNHGFGQDMPLTLDSESQLEVSLETGV